MQAADEVHCNHLAIGLRIRGIGLRSRRLRLLSLPFRLSLRLSDPLSRERLPRLRLRLRLRWRLRLGGGDGERRRECERCLSDGDGDLCTTDPSPGTCKSAWLLWLPTDNLTTSPLFPWKAAEPPRENMSDLPVLII